ncbi:hypothetical protein CO165_02320 [Candidatus Roizmanbacteria bacterium CG_4_9_14_3_um_filter_33_18]|uniref:Uncharacterized protein n=2 Tax=Candidatus Roizmaniibacteriota TaxID=1752723 RepID=A0A2M7XYF2_9BACT|nr:MAG: hypothetical protein COW97_01265 [Candidatus Roizmanbacteria bacterium CG22_combo_CG10-13_8_21_14_all_34_12]PJA55670.1 MAG: hypothetical protein CO165_02320 [Candidatus Roizmanbacteria bacterium CG_4_9_14_3_um_filter_33_18]
MKLKPIVFAGGGAALVFGVGQVVVGIKDSCATNPECSVNAVALGLAVAGMLGLRLVVKVFLKK